MSTGKLEPEDGFAPSFEKRAEDVYDALRRKLDKAPIGTNSFYFDKVEIEGLMGLLSHRFEGCF